MTSDTSTAAPEGRSAADDRPGLAIVSNVPRPDRVHAHVCTADGIPELKLHSLFTRSGWDFDWVVEIPERIHPVSFAIGEDLTRSVWGNPWKDWRKTNAIIRYLRANNVRAVILNGYANVTAVRLLRWCNRRGIPVFVRSDSNIRCERPGGRVRVWLKRKLVTWFVTRCDGVMPMGQFGLEFYQQYGAVPERCFWVPSVPDYSMFSDVPALEIEAFLKANHLERNRRRILFCGRLTAVKRVDLLVDAFTRIANDRPEWDLLVAGGGPLEQELRARIPESLADRVTWLGFRQWEELPPAYGVSDVLVLPSDFEPWAVVVIEAMAAGQVVVASDIVQAAHELFEDGVSGRLFTSGSVDSLTNALLDVTDESSFDRYRAEVPAALARWRRERDPVGWTRKALQSAGVLPRPDSCSGHPQPPPSP